MTKDEAYKVRDEDINKVWDKDYAAAFNKADKVWDEAMAEVNKSIAIAIAEGEATN